MKKFIISFILLFAGVSIVLPQETSFNKVTGLELPADQNVALDEGFVNLVAKCKGDVKWLVVSATKVKYVTLPQNTIIVSVPPQPNVVITVFAIGVVDGKMTEFAKTNVTTTGTSPQPVVGPTVGPLHVTFLVDLNNATPEQAALLNSASLRTAITSKGNFFRIYDLKSPVVAQRKLDGVAAKVGGNSVIIIQKNDGFVVQATVIPRTESEVIALVGKVR